MRPVFKLAGLIALGASVSFGQSLDPKNPAPLKPGVNGSNIDAFMTPHYWTFIVEKGPTKINVSFRAQSILGAPLRTQVAFNLYDINHPDKKYTKIAESTGQEVTLAIEGPRTSGIRWSWKWCRPKRSCAREAFIRFKR